MICFKPAISLLENVLGGYGNYVEPGECIIVCETANDYSPRNPEDNPLYCIVAENLETFLSMQIERGRMVPRFVERELRSFLDCGVLANG